MAKLNWIKPFILALVLVVFSSAAYWLVNTQKPKQEEKQEEAKKVVKIKEVQIDSIKIIDADRVFAFKCLDLSSKDSKLCKPSDQSKWELTTPLKLKADSANLNSFLSSLQYLSANQTIDLDTETEEKRKALLKDYKLDTPTRKIEVKTASGETLTTFFGETHPIGDSIFTLSGKDSKKVLLTPSYFKSNFDHDLTYWRDKKIADLNVSEVQKFELKTEKEHFTALKKDGQWLLQNKVKNKTQNKIQDKTDELPGDQDAIDSLLGGIVHLSAKQFPSENKDDPKAKDTLKGATLFAMLSMTTAGQEKEKKPPLVSTLLIYEKKSTIKKITKLEALYATSSGFDPLFELDTSAKNKFEKTVKDLRLAKLITSLERYNIKNLEFLGNPIGNKALNLQQKDSKWKSLALQKEIQEEIDNDKVNALLDKLSGTKILEFLQSSSIPTGEDSGLQVNFGDEKETSKRKFLFWKNSEKLYVRNLNSQRQEAFLLDAALKDSLPWNADFFKKAKPVPVAATSPTKK